MSDVSGGQAEPSPSSFSRMNLGLSQGLPITKQPRSRPAEWAFRGSVHGAAVGVDSPSTERDN